MSDSKKISAYVGKKTVAFIRNVFLIESLSEFSVQTLSILIKPIF
jgi:hypothetical protein